MSSGSYGFSILDTLGSGSLSAETERAFLEWCIVQTVRPALSHALTAHNMVSEGRLVMAANSAESVLLAAQKVAGAARQTMFRQLALWIQRATDYEHPRAAWDAAREAAVWSLIYSQGTKDIEGQAEQYQRFDKQIRQSAASRLREIANAKPG